MLVVDDLSFSYGKQLPPYHFTFAAAPGEVTAISGPSGSGKSTLLDLLAGFLHPASGQILLDGSNLVGLPPEDRPLSLLLQGESLFEHLSAARNVALGLPSRHGKTKGLVEQALREVGLEGIGSRAASTLSGGQKQRVALARTLLRNRPVLLLDEPFSALDDDTRAVIRTLVKTLTELHGWHTILVSHHADDVAALASRHYAIHDRQLREINPPRR